MHQTINHYFYLFNQSIDKGDYRLAEKHLSNTWRIIDKNKVSDSILAAYYLSEASLMNNLGRPEECVAISQKARRYISKTKMIAEMAKLENTLATAYLNMGEYEKSLDCMDISIKYFNRLKNKQAIANSLILKGNLLVRRGKWLQSMTLYAEALGYARKYNYEPIEAKANMSIGYLFRAYGFHYLAIESYEDAERIFKRINNEIGLWQAMYERANTLLSLREVDMAIKVINQLDKLEAASLPSGNKVWILWYLIHNQKGEFETALSYAQKMLDYSISINDRRGIADSMEKVGSSYFNLRDMNKAIEYGEKALEMADKLGDKLMQIQSTTLIDNAKKIYDEDTTRDK